MSIAILQHTPLWVWGLLAGLLALGLSQTRPRQVSRARTVLLPIAMAAFSISGVLLAFGHLAVAFAGWAAGAGVALTVTRRAVAIRGASWSADRATVRLPGSWLPLVLIVGLFSIKYIANVSMVLHPRLATDPAFAGACSLLYGFFSGVFVSRALSLGGFPTRSQGLQAA